MPTVTDLHQCEATTVAGVQCLNPATGKLCPVHAHGLRRLVDSDPELTREAQALGRKHQAAEARLATVRAEMRTMLDKLRAAGWGYDRIAAALGMTKAWAQQNDPAKRR